MPWSFSDMKKMVVDAKSSIEQSFVEAVKNGDEIVVQEEEVKKEEIKKEELKEETEEKKDDVKVEGEEVETNQESTAATARKSMAALFGGIKVGGGVASTKFFEYAKDAGKKLEDVKNAVIENTLLGELNKEQDEFEKQLQEEKDKNVKIDLPWQGVPDEIAAKKQILSLSTDTRNFLRDSPASSEYTFEQQQAMAALLLKEDPNLANVRFQLVPKQVKENQFWQNYFYRVGLIRQSLMGQRSGRSTPVVEKETIEETKEKEEPIASVSNEKPVEENVVEKKEDDVVNEKKETEAVESDVTQSDEDLDVLASATTEQPSNGDQTLTSVDEEWEKEILADLNEYEDVVEKTGNKDEEAWEAEIQELLNSE